MICACDFCDVLMNVTSGVNENDGAHRLMNDGGDGGDGGDGVCAPFRQQFFQQFCLIRWFEFEYHFAFCR